MRFSFRVKLQEKFQVELAVEARRVIQLEPEVQAQPAAELQRAEEAQAAPSAARMRSRRSANGRPDARWSGPHQRISPDNISASGKTHVARRIGN